MSLGVAALLWRWLGRIEARSDTPPPDSECSVIGCTNAPSRTRPCQDPDGHPIPGVDEWVCYLH